MLLMEPYILCTVPLARSLERNLRQSAEAAYCAGDQGKFWEMHDIIFANQTGENVGAYHRSSFGCIC